MDTTHSFAPPAPQPRPALPNVIPATFTGKVLDYFRIYYTNLFLTIITLGIYGSWAKVRNRRFFYGHTSFLGFVFDFDAKPLSILVSRIIVIAIIFGLSRIEQTWKLTIGEYGFTFLAFILLLPILVVRGRSFNLRYSQWRGVRFSYAKRFGPSFAHLFCFTIPQLATYSLLGLFFLQSPDTTFLKMEAVFGNWAFNLLLVLLTHFVLLLPIGYWWSHRIRVNQMSFGKLDFSYAAPVRAYVITYAKHFSLFAAMSASLAMISLANAGGATFTITMLIWLFATYFLSVSFVAHVASLFWNGLATTEGSKLQASFRPFAYAFWITVPNHLINIASFGTLLPYTRMRRWRYLAASISFIPSDSLREATAGATDVETAIASEALDIEGFDLDFGMI